MPVDIGQILDYSKESKHKRPNQVSIKKLFDIPIIILKWHTEESRFTDTNKDGLYVVVTFQYNGDPTEYFFNTGSVVIRSQLKEIKTKSPDVDSIRCVIRQDNNVYKLFPVEA